MDPGQVLGEIEALIAAPTPFDRRGFLAEVERTLTDGYAHALALEGERARIERRIGEIAAGLATGTELDREELAALSERLTAAEGQAARLRGRLSSLRERASDIRV
jgi:hypothetical protein